MSTNGTAFTSVDSSVFTFATINPNNNLAVYSNNPVKIGIYTIRIVGQQGIYISNQLEFTVTIPN